MADLAVARNDQLYERLRAHEARLYDAVLAGSAEGVRDAMHAVARADAAINTPPDAVELVGAEVIVPVPDASLYKYNTLDAALDALLVDAGFLALSFSNPTEDAESADSGEGATVVEQRPGDDALFADAEAAMDILLETNAKLGQALVTLDDELTEAYDALAQARAAARNTVPMEKLDELNRHIDRLGIQFENMQNESTRLKRRVRTLEDAENELKQTVASLKTRNLALRRELTAAVNSYRRLQKGGIMLELTNHTAQAALDDLRAREKALEAEVDRLTRQGSDARLQQARISDLERVNARLTSELSTANQTERELRAIIRSGRLYDDTQSNVTILELEAAVRNQETELKQERKRAKALVEVLKKTKATNRELKESKQKLKTRLEDAQIKRQNERETLLQLNNAQQAEIDTLNDQVATLEAQLTQITDARADLALQRPISAAASVPATPLAIAQELEPWPDMDFSDSDDSLSAEAAEIDVGALSYSLSLSLSDSLSDDEGEDDEGEGAGEDESNSWAAAAVEPAVAKPEAESMREMDWFDIV